MISDTILHGNPQSGDNSLIDINDQLLNWDLNAVEGRGLIRRMETYGHIEIKMYKSTDNNSKLIWKLTRDQLPMEFRAKEGVESTLSFFLNYIYCLRSEEILLAIEVTGGSYHPVDSKFIGYRLATISAIIDCFDKNAIKFKSEKIYKKLW